MGSLQYRESERQSRSHTIIRWLVLIFLDLLLILNRSQIADGSICQDKETRTSFCVVVHPRRVDKETFGRHRRTTYDSNTPSPLNRQFKFETNGSNFHLNLTLNERLLSSAFVVERRVSSNVSDSDVQPAYHQHKGCAYRGHVLGYTRSHVAVNVCKGLFGLISVMGEDFFIEPVKASNPGPANDQPHIIYKPSPPTTRSARSPKTTESFCSITNPSSTSDSHFRKNRSRRRRSVSRERTVETLVVVDHTMVEYYQDQHIETYVLTIMNLVSNFYHDPSIGNSVNIVLVRLIILEEELDDLEITHHADNTLESFCQWQDKNNPEGDYDPMHYDNAVLLTRKDLCQGIDEPCGTLGLAHVSGMCHRERSCSVNEDNGLALGFTVAHEMGHNFGMQHDGFRNPCTSDDESSPHVMSSRVLGGVTPVPWSTCSRGYITQFLDRGWGSCLEDVLTLPAYTYPQVLPGVMYSADHQCRLQYGPNATVCPMFESDLCTTLWCSVGVICQSRVSAAAPGTWCGKDKWCLLGSCVEIEEYLMIINGGWGSWSEWSDCSLTCGTGVISRERQCDNPRPTYGGKYCVGERKKYALVKLQECPAHSVSIRAMECSAFNAIQPDGSNYQWTPAYVEEKPCELFCRRRDTIIPEKMSARVLDGTPCTRLSNDVCIDGFCQRVGCDHQVNSAAVEDRCGVCHGDGSTCETIKDRFTKESGQGYVEVTVIPAGARNIIVEEIAAAGNYIAIRDTDGHYLLNGGWFIQWSGEYEAAGTTISYERIGDKERVEAQGPITEALHIMVLFRAQNPGVTYEYTVPRQTNKTGLLPQHFNWTFGDWSPCSASCGVGYQRSSVVCVERLAGVVGEMYCQGEKPDDIQQTCNEDQCPAIWWVGPWQHCSVSCGPEGLRQRSVFCIRGMMNGEQGVRDDGDCYNQGQGKPDTETACADILPCENTVYKWLAGEWSQCSATCGEGWHTRSVICVSTNDSCGVAGKPNERQPCFHQPCEPVQVEDYVSISSASQPDVSLSSDSETYSGDFVFSFGEWEKRSAAKKHDAAITNTSRANSFAANEKHRLEITTHDILGAAEGSPDVPPHVDPDSFFINDMLFDSDLDDEYQESSSYSVESVEGQAETPPLEWSAQDWQTCSVTCGEGIRRRTVECIDTTSGHRSSECSDEDQPAATQPCHMERCPPACEDTLSATVCMFAAQSGSCTHMHIRERCCIACSQHR